MSTKPTAQDLLKKVEALKPKVAALTSSSASFQGTGPDQGLAVHTSALLVKQAIEVIIPDAVNVQGPVPVPDATQILKTLKEIQVDTNTTLNHVINKKGLFDGLAAANLTALIRQDLKEIYMAFISLANALVDIAPAEILEQAKATRKEYDESIKKALALYQ